MENIDEFSVAPTETMCQTLLKTWRYLCKVYLYVWVGPFSGSFLLPTSFPEISL